MRHYCYLWHFRDRNHSNILDQQDRKLEINNLIQDGKYTHIKANQTFLHCTVKTMPSLLMCGFEGGAVWRAIIQYC